MTAIPTFLSPEWYGFIHKHAQNMHDVFLNWVTPLLPRIETVAEIGCGKFGYYHRWFDGKTYVGIDSEGPVIEHCRTLPAIPNHAWLCGAVENIPAEVPFDLVFSRSVIDHAPDIDAHLRATVKLAGKWCYIMSYRGFFGDLKAHRQQFGADKYWYNDLSVPRVEAVLKGCGVRRYELLRVPTGWPAGEIQDELHVVVEK